MPRALSHTRRCDTLCDMPDPQWKTVRLRTAQHERVEKLAKARERSTASYLESLVDSGLVRAEGRTAHGLLSLRNALAEAEEKGAKQAASILRDVIERESVPS